MIKQGPIRFDSAYRRAEDFVREALSGFTGATVLVRDLQGRIRIALDDREASEGLPTPEHRDELARKLHELLGAYSPGQKSIFMLASGMFDASAIFKDPDRLRLSGPPSEFYLLERNLTGADWYRGPFTTPLDERDDAGAEHDLARPPRVTFFGLKGGMGRSTAAAVWAWRLAQANKRVLVMDLDLESPGLGALLLPQESYPDYGVVDWLVESAVGQAGDELLRKMVVRSPLAKDTDGWISVIPADGRPRDDYSYLPKLSRAYGEANGQEFGDRLRDLVEQAEAQLRPDIVFLDSRAGLHDIAAVAVTRLDAYSFLFTANTDQTWGGYELLFAAWHRHHERARGFRDNLKMIAALVPETDADRYLSDFRFKSYGLFLRNIYEQADANNPKAFNYDLGAPEAPHSPLRINWSRAAQEFDPIRHPESLTEPQINAAFGQFVQEATLMVFGEEQV